MHQYANLLRYSYGFGFFAWAMHKAWAVPGGKWHELYNTAQRALLVVPLLSTYRAFKLLVSLPGNIEKYDYDRNAVDDCHRKYLWDIGDTSDGDWDFMPHHFESYLWALYVAPFFQAALSFYATDKIKARFEHDRAIRDEHVENAHNAHDEEAAGEEEELAEEEEVFF